MWFVALIGALLATQAVALRLNGGVARNQASLHMAFNFGGSSPKTAIPANKKLVVITGTSSGLGKECARALLQKDDYFVVCAVRDVNKMQQIADKENFPASSYRIVELDLASLQSVRAFPAKLSQLRGARPLDSLVCNAAVYQPALATPKYTGDDFEEQLQINHLSHFLLTSLLLPQVRKGSSKGPGGRVVIVGSITGNKNTIGGGLVLPLADLGELQGLEQGGKRPIAMIDGQAFNGAKAYKDSKVCNMMTVLELHKRYHASTGITFSSMYPGCIAETALFREKRGWFRFLFPLFMKYVTGGYVSEREAGQRLAEVVDSPVCQKSGVYWSWNGGARALPYKDARGVVRGTGGGGGEIFENTPSDIVMDERKRVKMWDYSTKIVQAVWPKV